MLTFGLVVEGIYDEGALKQLIQKCAESQVFIIVRQSGNAPQLMKRFPGFLEDFRYANGGSNVDKAIVIRDADGKDPAQLLNSMQGKVRGRTYPFPIRFAVIVQELEAWLLADEQAISGVTGKKQPSIGAPESLLHPKEKLRAVLSDAGVVYTAPVAEKIAADARVDTIASRCSSFQRFREAVVDC